MNKPLLLIALLAVAYSTAVQAQLFPDLGGQRAGTSTAQFLKIGVGARATAMGESFVSVANDASALYWNPAGLTQFSQNQAFFGHTNWLVDIGLEFVGAVYHLTPEDAVGISVTSLHTDDMQVTTEVQPLGTGEYFKFGDVAVGVSYGRKLTDQFSFGGTVRYVDETLDMLKMNGVMLDFGTYYWTGLGTSRFSAVVANFGNQMKPTGTAPLLGGGSVTSFQEFTPPTIFRFGFAFEPINDDDNVMTTSFQLNHPNDNSENFGVGIEYRWMKIFSLRGGYKINASEQTYSLGVGFETSLSLIHVGVDYGFASFTDLGGVHRISILVGL